jgi:predicted SprT family Zn-dependent metalloprotease
MGKKKETPREKILRLAKKQMRANGTIKCYEDTRPVGCAEPDLQICYNQLNTELFGGELPHVPVIWNTRLRRAYGKAFYTSTGLGKRRGTRANCSADRIEIRPQHQWTDRFLRKVLTHEMCHVWAFTEYGEVGHGPMFWKQMRKVGYPQGHEWPGAPSHERDIYCD